MRIVALLCFLILLSFSSQAQEDFELRFQHNGRYDFTMIGASFNATSNNGVGCNELNLPIGATAIANLNLEVDQTIQAAYLFWSSNLTIPDAQVTFNGTNIIANDTYTDSFGPYSFSGAVADVTNLVIAQGNTDYTLEDLNINRNAVSGSCSTSYGGWSLLVVYEDPDFPLNSVNVYYGFRGISTNSGRLPITIDITDLLIANEVGSFLGILAWEGDLSLGGPQYDEEVRFNNNLLGNNLNPVDNVFNETDSFNGQNNFRNMDMDRFSIDQYVSVGDMQADIYVESEQDLAIMNVIAFTLGNELPEPTVNIISAESDCDEGEINVSLEVNNFNANAELPAGTSVKFYIDQVSNPADLEVFTTTDIPIGGTELIDITLPYPPGNPNSITIFASVNLDNNGDPIILELNSNNNRDNELVDVAQPPQIAIAPYEECDQGNSIASFDLDNLISDFEMSNPNISISIHETQENADNNTLPLTGIYQNTSNPHTLFARQVDMTTSCVGTVSFQLIVNDNPESSNTSLQECSSYGTATFTLSDANNNITNEADVTITYYATLMDAQSGNSPLPNSYNINGDTTVYGRVEFNTTGCYSVAELELQIIANPENIALQDELLCDDDGDGSVQFDLNSKIPEILGSQDPAEFSVSFHNTQADAQNNANAIQNPSSFSNTTNPQTIFVRIENNLNTDCFIVQDFSIIVNQRPPANDVPISVPTCSSTNSAIFDLTSVALEVANNDTNMIVDFFEDAALQNQITNPSSYASQGALTTVYGRVTDPATGCFSVGEILLEVLANPAQSNQSLTECATDGSNTQAVFYLTILTADIIGNSQNVTVSYHVSQTDADSPMVGGLNPITNPDSFSSTTATIYARSEANYQGNRCHTVSEITLEVNPRPTANEITYSLCSNGSSAVFDLDARIDDITDGAQNVSISFYEESALQNQITNSAAYNSGIATIYVLVIDDVTNCEEISPIQLNIESIPVITEELSLEQCLQNQIATFDLTTITSGLAGNYPNLELAFYEDDAFLNQINSNTYSVTATTTIYLQYNIPGSDCNNFNEVSLIVPESPIQDFGDIIICLSNGHTLPDGTQVFETGLYEVPIQDPVTGCDTLTRTNLIVGEVLFPTAFAPNGNNNNEGFGPIPGEECVGEVTDFYMEIYNRWGEKVFQTTSFTNRWDGRYNGELQNGTFLWTASYSFQGESIERNGTIAVLN